MEREAMERINRKVSKQFPEMKSVRPSVKVDSKSSNGRQKFALTYKGKVELPNGRKLSRVVHVVADENGKVIRMSTSK